MSAASPRVRPCGCSQPVQRTSSVRRSPSLPAAEEYSLSASQLGVVADWRKAVSGGSRRRQRCRPGARVQAASNPVLRARFVASDQRLRRGGQVQGRPDRPRRRPRRGRRQAGAPWPRGRGSSRARPAGSSIGRRAATVVVQALGRLERGRADRAAGCDNQAEGRCRRPRRRRWRSLGRRSRRRSGSRTARPVGACRGGKSHPCSSCRRPVPRLSRSPDIRPRRT